MDTETTNVESFNLDHRLVRAPYLRLADRKVLPRGDVLTKWDLRFTQPNRSYLEAETVHSIEHTFADAVRNHSGDVIDFSPMGCQTGFYLLMSGDYGFDAVAAIVAAGMADVAAADHVPAANEAQCGQGRLHDLDGARSAAADFLAERDGWAEVF